MTKYVAFLRGIGPSNPNMHGGKLVEFFESLGFKNVRSFISSGNVLFESPENNVSKIEEKIEKALPEKLGFKTTTIIRSKKDLEDLIAENPFKNLTHGRETYLNVSFLKENAKGNLKFPLKSAGYEIVEIYLREICFVIDQRIGATPYMMNLIEKEYDKKVTTRTWKTITRIASLM